MQQINKYEQRSTKKQIQTNMNKYQQKPAKINKYRETSTNIN